MKVVWTKEAQRDIKAIYDFIAADSEYYAAEVVETILDAERRIGECPTAGQMVREEMRKDLRQGNAIRIASFTGFSRSGST
ncbi:MAG: type II toxin-antitoxin system RelE/ParE family toxin [Opitutaceae bacterium]